jgi:hypothetical protein
MAEEKQASKSGLVIVLAIVGGIALLGCCGIGGGVALIGFWSKGPATQVTKTPLVVSPAALTAEFRANEADANARYKGKWVQVRGEVDQVVKNEINKDMLSFTLKTEKPLETPCVQCFIDDPYTARTVQLRQGETVTVNGKCDGKVANICIIGCEFVR